MTSTLLDQVLGQKAGGRFRTAQLGLEADAVTLPARFRVAWLTASAELLHLTGDGQAAAPAARRVLRSSDATAECRARCHAVLGAVAAEGGEVARSLSRYRRALEVARDAADAELGGCIRLEIVESLGPDATARLAEECSTSATTTGHPHLLVRLQIALAGIATREGRSDDATSHLMVAAEVLSTRENLWLEGLLALGRADACALEADHGQAVRYGRAALGHATRSGHLGTRMGSIATLARAKLAIGNVQESEALCTEALSGPGGAAHIRVALLDTLARISLHRGQPRECRQRLVDLDCMSRGRATFPPASELLSAFATRARLACTGSLWHEALAICENGIARTDESGDLPHGLSLRCLKADACRELGRIDTAARAIGEAREMAGGAPLPLIAEVLRAAASLLGAATSPSRARPALERSLRLLSAVGAVDARRDGTLSYLRETSPINPALRHRLDAKPWDLNPAIRKALPGRTSRPIPTRSPAPVPDLLDLAALGHLASRPALLAQELFILLRGAGCARGLAILSTPDGRSFQPLAHEGWSADAAMAAARRPEHVTSIPCGRDADDELHVLVRPNDDAQAQALVHALKSHTDRLVALETLRRSERDRSSLWPPDVPAPGDIGVFASPAMRQLVETAKKAAASTLPILITGESGTGKEVLARLIHRHSGRAVRDFVPYNCTGAPRDMIDSQLFGHRRGSFTGAYENALGLVRAAGGGTLLLDEVSELDPHTQPKLLRLLENNEVQPLGEARPITVDVRVIAATNANLAELVRTGRFREDLFFRLNTVNLAIPPLRERRDDIPPLVHHFLRRYGTEHGRPHLRLTDGTLRCLVHYEWPGNVRQLSNEIRRLTALVDNRTTITPELLSPDLHPAASALTPGGDARGTQITIDPDQTLATALATVERTLIRRALQATKGRFDDDARLLGLTRKGLFLKRRRLGIDSVVA